WLGTRREKKVRVRRAKLCFRHVVFATCDRVGPSSGSATVDATTNGDGGTPEFRIIKDKPMGVKISAL
ncbi:MAG: hypothetical protein AAF327_18990, partial [Cyanobacteria bacterium P01_A01_bin.37]